MICYMLITYERKSCICNKYEFVLYIKDNKVDVSISDQVKSVK